MADTDNTDLLRLVEPWEVREAGELITTKVFTLRQRVCTSATSPDKTGTFVYLDCGDWVNVVTLTPEREVVLIEQYRHGVGEVTLEIPGGMVDPGEDPLAAALRELQEETGYTGEPAELIGAVTPNPAIQNNRCHTALVQNATPGHGRHLDGNEEIGVRLAPIAAIPDLIRRGVIHHSLVIAAFFHFALRDPTAFDSRGPSV